MNELETPSPRPGRVRRLWGEWLRPVLTVVIVLGAFRSAVADWNDVPSGSMKPTILEGDRIVVNKLAYGLRVPLTRFDLVRWGDPARGEIVTVASPADGKRLVKRVVAVAGDTVELQRGVLLVNGAPAKYSRLPADAGRDLPDASERLLAREEQGGSSHAMMLTPARPGARSYGPVTVPAEKLFLLGDNRDESYDSRYFGFADRSAVTGRAVAVAASVDLAHHWKPRWHRFFRPLG